MIKANQVIYGDGEYYVIVRVGHNQVGLMNAKTRIITNPVVVQDTQNINYNTEFRMLVKPLGDKYGWTDSDFRVSQVCVDQDQNDLYNFIDNNRWKLFC